jgi:hypothetical protein
MFKNEFGRVDENQDQKVDTGGVAILNLGQRVIYNLVTKERYLDTPSYGSLRRALKAMRRDAIERDVKKIAMPRIGCGAERFKWKQVKDLLVLVFKDTDIEITVYTNALRDDEQIDSKLADKTRKGEERKSEPATAGRKKAERREPKVGPSYSTSRLLPEVLALLKTELRQWWMEEAAKGQTDSQSQEGEELLKQGDANAGRKIKTTMTRQLTGQDQTDQGETSHHENHTKTNGGTKDEDPGQTDPQGAGDRKSTKREKNTGTKDKTSMKEAKPYNNSKDDMAGKAQVINHLEHVR